MIISVKTNNGVLTKSTGEIGDHSIIAKNMSDVAIKVIVMVLIINEALD